MARRTRAARTRSGRVLTGWALPPIATALGLCLTLLACGGPADPSYDGPRLATPARAPATQPEAVSSGFERPAPPTAHTPTPEIDDVAHPAAELWHSDDERREEALESFLSTASHPDPQSLALLLTDADHRIRQTVIDGLLERGDARSIPWLRLAEDDPHPAVRAAAAEAIEELSAGQ